jgi:glycosyltransferase involved in cell wall biosynthesis
MRISICIPQYNRIEYLLKSLDRIRQQTYSDLEVVISDDASVDDTMERIRELKDQYPFPIIYRHNERNLGYDRNLRQALELATGDYLFILGNDDTLAHPDDMQFLATFLSEGRYPEVGFCNYVEAITPERIFKRASSSCVVGSGPEVAQANAGSFSFVAGVIFKRGAFERCNTDRFDGSIYVQIYLACRMIASGDRLFTIERPMVVKDLILDKDTRGSYRDKIARRWKDMRKVDGGLPSVIHVLIEAFKDVNLLTQERIYRIFNKIYGTTFPHWLLEYRMNHALPESVGMVMGMNPVLNKHYFRLNYINRIRIYLLFIVASLAGLLSPVFLYKYFKPFLFAWVRRKGVR